MPAATIAKPRGCVGGPDATITKHVDATFERVFGE
jgi:hypothetical protein